MKVSEFITQLQKLDPDIEIVVGKFDDLHKDMEYVEPKLEEERVEIIKHKTNTFLMKWCDWGVKVGEKKVIVIDEGY